MLYGNVCFRPRVIGCTFELAESVFAFCRILCVQILYHSSGQAMVRDFFYNKILQKAERKEENGNEKKISCWFIDWSNDLLPGSDRVFRG